VTDSFLGEIRMFSFDWAPQTWALCDGTILQIQQNQALNSLITNWYGGDGVKTFALPDFRGRTWRGRAPKEIQGTTYGSETAVLDATTSPPHNHTVRAVSSPGGTYSPAKNDVLYAQTPAGHNLYAPPNGTLQPLFAGAVGNTGGGPAGTEIGHDNMQPYAVINFCICTIGVYPMRP